MVTPRKTADKKPVYDDDDDRDPYDTGTVKHGTVLTENDDELSEEDTLNIVLSELGGSSDAKVNVYLNEAGKSAAFVGSYAPDAFSIDAIQASYGAGDYSIQVRANGRIRARRNIRIAKPRTDLVSVVNTVNNEQLIATMQQGFASMLDGIRMMIPQQAPAKTTQDLLQDLLLMKQLVAPPPNTGGQGIDDFIKMFSLVKEITPREGETGTNDLIMEGLRSLAPILTQAQQNRPVQVFDRVPQPNMKMQPSPLPTIENAPAVAPETAQESPEMNIQEKLLFNLLIKNAEADNEPETYAHMLLDIAGIDEAEKMINMPGWFEILVNRDPRIAPHREWFNELRDDMLTIIADSRVLTNASDNVTNINNTQQAQTDATTEKSSE